MDRLALPINDAESESVPSDYKKLITTRDSIVMTASQVAELLGCTEQTVEEYARKGVIPSVKFGRSRRYPIEAFAEQVNSLARISINPLANLAPEATAANEDFAIVTAPKSVSVGRLRKSPVHEFGTTRRAKKA